MRKQPQQQRSTPSDAHMPLHNVVVKAVDLCEHPNLSFGVFVSAAAGCVSSRLASPTALFGIGFFFGWLSPFATNRWFT
jgi:hypothetical protein